MDSNKVFGQGGKAGESDKLNIDSIIARLLEGESLQSCVHLIVSVIGPTIATGITDSASRCLLSISSLCLHFKIYRDIPSIVQIIRANTLPWHRTLSFIQSGNQMLFRIEGLGSDSTIIQHWSNNTSYYISVRGSRPGKNVQLTENEIRGLCLKSRELFLSQPILLELEAPLKICGMKTSLSCIEGKAVMF